MAAPKIKDGDLVFVTTRGLSGVLLDIYDDRFGDPVVWRVRLITDEIVMEQADRLRLISAGTGKDGAK